jgi:ribonucleoside-triphosphate reductase
LNSYPEGLKIFSKEVSQAHLSGDLYIHYLKHPQKAESIGWNSIQEEKEKNLKCWFKLLLKAISKQNDRWLKQTINNFDSALTKYIEREKQNRLYEYLIKFLSSIRFDNEYHHLSFRLNLLNEKIYSRANNAFIKALLNLNMHGNFNISPLYMISELEDNSRTLEYIIAWAFKYGSPVFLNSHLVDEFENEDIAFRQGGVLGDFTGKGRISSVTLNLPRISYIVNDEDIFYERLQELTWLASKCLEEKRYLLEKNPGFDSLDNLSSVISIVGVNEVLHNLIDCGISAVPGKAVAYKILEALRDTILEIIDETGHKYSLEAGESMQASHRLAQLDVQRYPNIFTSGNMTPYYTHSSELPSYYGNDLWNALEHQKKIYTMYTGGTTFRVHLSKEIKFNQGCKLLIKRILERFYYTSVVFNPVFFLCNEHGYMKTGVCNQCSKPTTLYRRIAGIIRPIYSWDEGQKEEYYLREHFDVKSR